MTRRTILLWTLTLTTLAAAACGSGSSSGDAAAERQKLQRIKIGFLMDTTHERWIRDRDLFTERVAAAARSTPASGGERNKSESAEEDAAASHHDLLSPDYRSLRIDAGMG